MNTPSNAPLDWEDVRVFVALARHGSLSAASRALSINHTTVARRIQSLEASVGERLVERRPDGYVLTAAGAKLLGPATAMESAAASFARREADDMPHGLVRINAPPSLAQVFLAARLAGLSARYPNLDLELAPRMRLVSLDRRETDIGLRYQRPLDGAVVARQLATIGFGFYASADWQQRCAAGAEPVFVGFDEVNSSLVEAAWLAQQFPRARMAFRGNNHLIQAMAAAQGAGIALLPHFIGRADAALQACDLGLPGPMRELWMVTRPEDRRHVAIQAVVAHLVELFGEHATLFDAA